MLAHTTDCVRWFEELGVADLPSVGGKNASLGEMIRTLGSAGVRVPPGFATTAEAYREFVAFNGLANPIREQLARMARGEQALEATGLAIRGAILAGEFPEDLAETIRGAYRELSKRCGVVKADVAVRSSATAEDLPEASFAGQQESFLNVVGEGSLLSACRECYASLFTDRAISYREQRGFDHMAVALSIGVQKMVRSDQAGAGVMFTIDTETGYPHLVLIDACWGLGESIVKGTVTGDEYRFFKPAVLNRHHSPILEKRVGTKESKIVYRAQGSGTLTLETTPAERRAFVLTDAEALQLARWACVIENHYGRPMDIEWAKDGATGELFIVQARPETVQSRRSATSITTYRMRDHEPAPIVTGQAVGAAIAAGPAVVVSGLGHAQSFPKGGILVAEKTDPDWVPIMKRAAGIVTDHGGRTSHAAIVSRELGLPAVIGTGQATRLIRDGLPITLSCAKGETGYVYEGLLAFEERRVELTDLPATRTKVLVNLASPEAAMRSWALPADGVGLARMEFIISNLIKLHPLALTRFGQLRDPAVREQIERITEGYRDRTDYFVEQLARGIATIAAARYPSPVIVRLSDFKTNEYAHLIGGQQFEPHEENPMIGFRGASRYYSDRYRDGFALECRAMKFARQEIGLDNIIAMIPFCRTPEEADRVLQEMERHGLKRGENGFKVYVMAEIPSNVILAEEFASRFDGFSIGSNDLTQLVLGVDRDSAELAPLFDDRHEAVRRMIRQLIQTAHRLGKPVGICGQAPSDHPEYAKFLVEAGIDSISVNPDCVVEVRRTVAEAEKRP